MTVAALFAALVLQGSAQAAEPWQQWVRDNGVREASVAGEAAYGSVRSAATLRLKCRPGPDGTVAWEMELAEASRLAEFGFADYEGPDAPAAKQALSEIVPEGGLLRTTVRSAAAGYFGVAGPDTFVFSASAPANAASDIALLAEIVAPETLSLTWTVRSTQREGTMIVATFPTEGAPPALRETMMGCGPAPALDVKALAAALGRNPADAGLWKLRGLEWRLKGVLGVNYAGFAARMESAQPLARDGDRWFVLSAEAASPAAAVFFDARDIEAVLIDEGGAVRRHASGTLAAPEAVREFVASRVAGQPPSP